ncbi:hypothetical protein D3C81_2218200 [compost metagenome]
MARQVAAQRPHEKAHGHGRECGKDAHDRLRGVEENLTKPAGGGCAVDEEVITLHSRTDHGGKGDFRSLVVGLG